MTSKHPPPPDDGTGKIPGVQGRWRGRRGGGGRSVEKGVGERQGERQGGGCGGGQPRPERAWRTISHVRRGVRWISWEGGRNGPRRPRRRRSSSVCRHSFDSRFRFSILFRKPRESRRIRRTKYQVLVVTCFDLHSGHGRKNPGAPARSWIRPTAASRIRGRRTEPPESSPPPLTCGHPSTGQGKTDDAASPVVPPGNVVLSISWNAWGSPGDGMSL